MLLAIDVGNTNIMLGVYQGAELLDTWRISTVHERTGDELGALFGQLLSTAGITFEGIQAVAVSNVVPPLAPAVRHFARRYVRREPEFIGEALKPEIAVRYTPKAAVGADRLADAVAVLKLYGTPALVVDLGTATTFDAISHDGEYLGGAIAPGVGISLEALFRAAAHLPRIEMVPPEHVIGSSTVESMQSGAYYGFIGQIEGVVKRFVAELGEDTHVIATGGLAEVIARETPCIRHVAPYLTLEGLRLVWEAAHRD